MKINTLLLAFCLFLGYSFGALSQVAQSDTLGNSVVFVPKRAVKLEGGSNFRDLGGYPTKDGRHVKWGHIYRSADISKLTDADLKTLQNMHLSVICDLRGPQEYQSAPDRVPTGAKRIELPAGSENTGTMATMIQSGAITAKNSDSLIRTSYAKIDPFKAKYQPLFDQLLALNGDQSLLFHCTAGKDRTGIGAALVLSALGVDKQTVLADYAATNVFWKDYRDKQVAQMAQAGINEAALRPMLAANPSYLEMTFAAITKQYGSMDKFLATEMGLTPEKLTRLRAKYLD